MAPICASNDTSGLIAIDAFVLQLAWTCLQDTPVNEKNVLYDESITSETVLRDLASSHPMEFALGLNEVLQSKDASYN